jgi:hypothetical protein
MEKTDRELAASSSSLAALDTDPAVSWNSIWAGVAVALAVSLLLGLLAAGFGLNLGFGALASRGSLAAFTPALGAGAIIVQVIAAGLGGYVAGRLRREWRSVHIDETHFRDTAHGLVVWAVSTLAGVILTATVFEPYMQQLSANATSAGRPPSPADVDRAAHVLVQSAFFTAVGMLLSAFIAAVTARIGGLRAEEMHAKRRA